MSGSFHFSFPADCTSKKLKWQWVKIQSKVSSKMGSEFSYPNMVPLVLTHSHVDNARPNLDGFRENNRKMVADIYMGV